MNTRYYIIKGTESYLHKDKTFYVGIFDNVLVYKTKKAALKKLEALWNTYTIKELFPDLRVLEVDSDGNRTSLRTQQMSV